jgi:hypothetical protein
MGKPNLKLMLELEVRDKNGKLLEKRSRTCHSFLKNFAWFVYAFFAATNVTRTNTGGGSATFYGSRAVTITGENSPMKCNAASADDSFGIQVGSGTTPVSRDDYALATKISHGTAAGQLAYGTMTIETVNGTPPESQFRIIRTFSNSTADAITVYEIGLAISNRWADVETKFLIARDVLSAPVTVPAGATLTIRYIFKVTA